MSHTRLRTRLIGMVLVPVVPLALLSLGDIRRLDDEATQATRAADRIERSMPMHRLVSDLALEQLLSTALVKQSLAQVTDETVRRQTGLDLDALLATSRQNVDADLASIAKTLPLPADTVNLIARVINLRPAIDRKAAMVEQIARDFTGASGAVEAIEQDDFERVVAALGRLPDGPDLVEQYQFTERVFGVVRLHAEEVLTYSNYVIPTLSAGDEVLQFAAALGSKRDVWAEVEADLNGRAARAAWDKVVHSDAAQSVAQAENAILADFGLSTGQAGSITDIAPVFISASAILITDLSAFAVAEAQTLTASSRAAIAHTDSELRMAIVRALVLALVTAGLLIVTLRTIVVPLRRVEKRAQAVSRGELDLTPLPPRGPHEVLVVSEAMNDLCQNFDRLVAHFSQLSALDTADALSALDHSAGQSLQAKIDHLGSVAQRAREVEIQAKAIVEHAGDAMFSVDGDGLLRHVNAVGARLLGYDASQLIGSPIRRYLRGDLVTGENTVYQIGGPDIPVALSVNPVEGTPMLTVVARDITLDKQREAELSHAARHDALTGLSNRVALMEELDRAIVDAKQSMVFFLDLDGFKSVNDTWGHAVGDELLVAVSRRLTALLREGDLAARYGGDEFVTIVHGLPDHPSAIRFGKRLIEAIEEPFQLGPRSISISTSVGVVRLTGAATAAELLHRADVAAYSAKSAGRGNIRINDPEEAARLRSRRPPA